MMKKLLATALTAAMLGSMLVGAVSVQAEEAKNIPELTTEPLPAQLPSPMGTPYGLSVSKRSMYALYCAT